VEKLSLRVEAALDVEETTTPHQSSQSVPLFDLERVSDHLPIERSRYSGLDILLNTAPPNQIIPLSTNSLNMGSKNSIDIAPEVSYTELEDVESVQDQTEALQVATSRKVGIIRGFFIMMGALGLSIFIGIVVVFILNDINDRPQHNGYYGHPLDVAQPQSCRFHILSLDWLRPSCRTEEPIQKFRNLGPGDWHTDADLDEDCDMEKVPSSAKGSSLTERFRS